MATKNNICTKCIMDYSDPDIKFNDEGICNHCLRYESLVSSRVFDGTEGEKELNSLVDKIKKEGKNKDYDCLIGVSGGVDSTYVAYLLKKRGIKTISCSF